MAKFTIHSAKTNLSKLILKAARGEEVIIARDDEPVARLVPMNYKPPQRRFGALKGRIKLPESFFDPLPLEERKRWGQ
jgi:prevent-host-death family protein